MLTTFAVASVALISLPAQSSQEINSEIAIDLRGSMTAGTIAGCACGDLDANDNVNVVDYATFAKCFGLEGPTDQCEIRDFNCADSGTDGSVNLLDFSTFSLNFGGAADCIPTAQLEYGIKHEGSTPYAFIGIRNGRELAAVAFDATTDAEDYATERFLGHTAEQLDSLPPGTDAELLYTPLFVEAAALWQGAFPDFEGPPAQRAILSRQSQLLAILASLVGADNNAAARGVNGCNVVPDFDISHCCDKHDICYEGCGKSQGCSAESRSDCDSCAFQCILDSSYHPGLAALFWAGLTVFGELCSDCDESGLLCSYCPTCDDGNICTADICNPKTGCEHENLTSPFLYCDDDNACTIASACNNGHCVARLSDYATCRDVNDPTVGCCEKSTGCYYRDDFCKEFDTACFTYHGGIFGCTPVTTNCNDNDSNTYDGCNAQNGCYHFQLPTQPSAICLAKNDACNTSTYANNVCAVIPTNCDDANPCTRDRCNASTGCWHSPVSLEDAIIFGCHEYCGY